MTEDQARSHVEALAFAMGITSYFVRSREGRVLSVQMTPRNCEVVATIAPPISGQARRFV
jgi:hypothetical protein